MRKKIDPMVWEIWGILLIYGGLVQLIGMWFVKNKGSYTIGLWIGIALAVFMIWHMHLGITKALELDEDDARKKSLGMYAIRLGVVCAVVLCVLYFKIGNVLLTFIGMFGLKIAAYLQPTVHEWLMKKQAKGE